jgi:hypothetical protein
MANPAVQDIALTISTLLKTVYGPAIVEQQNMTPAMYKRFKRSTVKFGGNDYQFPARMQHPQSLGMRGLRVGLPTPLSTTDVTAKVTHKYFYATGDITGPEMEAAKGNRNAFVDHYSDKMSAITKSALKELNFQFYLDGTGVYASWPAGAGAHATATKMYVDTIKYLRVGRPVDLWDDSGNVLGDVSGKTIVGLTIESDAGTLRPTVQFSANRDSVFVTAAGDDIIPTTGVAQGAATPGIYFSGLKAIVDDGTAVNVFQNINRTTNPLWKAKVLGNSGSARPLTLQLMQVAVDTPEILSGMPIELILGSYNARNLYLQLLVSQKRFMNTGKLDGGYEALDFNGKRFLVDVDAQDDRIYFLNESSIEHFGLLDLKFDESDGSILKHQGLTAGDVFYFFLKAYANFGARQCNCNSVITDLEVDTNYLLAA